MPATLQAQNRDTSALFQRARRAQMAYLAGARAFAPSYPNPGIDHPCDEWVGRYCLIYDTGNEKLPPEPARLRAARDSAIAALRRAFSVAPAAREFAQALVRDLVKDGRSAEAVGIARAHARAKPGDPQTDMLLGFALAADRQTPAALEAFARWLGSLPAAQRQRVRRSDWLLDPAARKDRSRLDAGARARLDSLLWRYADPLYLTPGNELLAGHLARNALVVMKLESPRIWNEDPWGEDSEQLLIRFGEPVLSTRAPTTSVLGSSAGYSDHWDPLERTYFPPQPQTAVSARPPLDTIWHLDSLTARSGHVPATIRIMRVLEHQGASFGPENPRYVVAGKALADSAVRPAALRGALFLLDSALRVVGQGPAKVRLVGDSVVFRAEAPMTASVRYYSAEVYDTLSRYAARARYAVQPIDNVGALTLSGLLLSSPERLDQPLLRPVVVSGDRFGVYTQLSGTGPTRVELEIRSVDGLGVPVKVARWLGRRLGIQPAGPVPALSWTLELKPGEPDSIALAVDPGELRPGRYLVRLSARTESVSNPVVAEREFLVISRKEASSARP